MILLDKNFTAEKVLKITQKQEKKVTKIEWINIKECIRKTIKRGETSFDWMYMREKNIQRLKDLGYKVEVYPLRIKISWGEE